MNSKIILVGFFGLVLSSGLNGQSTEEDKKAVYKVVETMFEGMRLGDSSMVAPLFTEDAEFFSSFTTKTGEKSLKKDGVQGWLDAIGTPHEQVWNEEWWEPSINVDGDFGHLWTPYAFYIDDTFSHCGVDSFHMVRDASGVWKVFHATDTRRRSGCEDFIPDHIKKKHQSD